MPKYLHICLALILGHSSFAQPINVSGTVLDEGGTPLTGATILESGTKNATFSSANGSFRLSVADSNVKLIVTYVGYLKQELKASAQQLTVSMVPSIANMNDIVMIGYGTSRRRDLTGAVSSVAAKDFNKGMITSPDQLIQGKVSGVQITSNNGTPGGAANIKVRGNSALVGLGQPLFVLDGIPLDGRSLRGGDYSDLQNNFGDGLQVQGGINPLTFISPDDIASIEVLKDASATAIYGSRGAYGVVIINTKKGQTGEPRISFSAATGFSQIKKKIDVLNPLQYRQAIPYYGVSPDLDHGASVNAMDSILQTGFQQNYSLSISGGGDHGKYRISGNYLDQEGILKMSGLKKYGMNMGTSFGFLTDKRLKLDINLNANQYIQEGSEMRYGGSQVVGFALGWNPTDSLHKADGNVIINPVLQNENVRTNLKVNTVLGSLAPSFRITSWLEYKMFLSYLYSTGINRFSVNDILFNSDPKGIVSISNTEQSTKQITHTLEFKKDLSNGLHLSALAGYEYVSYDMKGNYMKATGAPGIGFGNYGLDYTNYIQFSSSSNRKISSFADPTNELQSFFGRAMFNYKERYFFTGTFRADGSTKFGTNNKYGYFPSFAGAWQISNEDFFHVDFINSLKLRAGWGKTGNQDFPSGASQAKYSFYDNGTLSQVNNPNPNLKWQTDVQYNFGIDFSILKGRISGTIDYFNKTTTDLLFPSPPIQPAPPASTVRWINLPGDITNKGLEVLLNLQVIQGKDWQLLVSANASFLQNKVSKMPTTIATGWLQGGGVSGTSVEVIENGQPMNAFFTRKFLGMDKNTGLSIYADDGNTFYHLGDPNPKTLAGFNANLSYKKFSLGVNMYGSFGQDIYYNTLMTVINVGKMNTDGNIATQLYKEPVKESLANPVTPSSRFIYKGNYFKLNNATFTYALGKIGKAIRDVRIYITGQNLFSFTKYPGFDPESNFDINNYTVPSLGIDYVQYPPARTVLFGINFSL